ncbi:MAG: PIN domain-containing protein [Candidatus Omnitrophica bacterium]|nr:PIN domain-containing protein [Candidatus Omnitrophota bacterium]
MSERLVLVDSSVWITHLLGRGGTYAHTIRDLLLGNRVAINAVIRLELLTGARDETQYAELEGTLDGLHFLELTAAVWRRAERLRFQLRRQGAMVPLPDAVIACCALIYNCELLHADRHFDRIAHATALKIHR